MVKYFHPRWDRQLSLAELGIKDAQYGPDYDFKSEDRLASGGYLEKGPRYYDPPPHFLLVPIMKNE